MSSEELDFYGRRERIKTKLLSGRRVSTRELCEEFNVTKQTILKDINRLTPTFPVTAFKGPGGGYEYAGEPKLTISVELFKELCDAKRDGYAFSDEAEAELKRLSDVLAASDGTAGQKRPD